jgi:hypothetical protein
MWARRMWDGSYFVLKIRKTSRVRAVFKCVLVRIDLRETTQQAMNLALAHLGSGFRLRGKQLYTFLGDELAFPRLTDVRLKCLEALAQDGRGAVLHTEVGRVAGRVLAKCARAAYGLEHDPVRLERELDKPWAPNLSPDWIRTNREYGAGAVNQRDPTPPAASTCPEGLLFPGHYWENGGCKCDDAVHRGVLSWWGIPTDPFRKEVPPPYIRNVVQWES